MPLHIGPGFEADIEAQQGRSCDNACDGVIDFILQPPVIGGHATAQREGICFHLLYVAVFFAQFTKFLVEFIAQGIQYLSA